MGTEYVPETPAAEPTVTVPLTTSLLMPLGLWHMEASAVRVRVVKTLALDAAEAAANDPLAEEFPLPGIEKPSCPLLSVTSWERELTTVEGLKAARAPLTVPLHDTDNVAVAPVLDSVTQLKGLEGNVPVTLPVWIRTARFDVAHRRSVPFRIEGLVPPPDAEIAGENAIVADNRQVTAPEAGPVNLNGLAAAGPIPTPSDATE